MATLSQNVTQAISDFAAIKTALEDKGVTVPSGTPTADYADLIEDISIGDYSDLIGIIDGSITNLVIPEGITSIRKAFMSSVTAGLSSVTFPDGLISIGESAFSYCRDLRTLSSFPSSLTTLGNSAFQGAGITSVSLPASLTNFGVNVFHECSHLQSVNIANGITTIPNNTFRASGITSCVLPNSVTSIGNYAFYGCVSLETLYLPSSLQTIGESIVNYSNNLKYLTLGNGFNVNGLNLQSSTRYEKETIIGWFNALADRTGETAYNLSLGQTNLNKLTAAEKAIATNKNWNIF